MKSTVEGPQFDDPRLWQPVTNCMVCGGENFYEVRKAPDPHYRARGLFPIFRCRDCGLQFLNPQPTPAYLATAYPDNYYSYTVAPTSKFKKRIKQVLRYLLVFHAFKTNDPRFERPGSMLDIGCGAGEFLKEMREKGWKARGVEVCKAAAQAGRAYGLDIFGGTLPEARFADEEFDYVRLNHSFEHIDNPRAVLHEIRRILKTDGKLFIGVPNVDSLPANFFGESWYNLGPPTHTYGYSPKSLTALLEQEGFVVEKIKYAATYAGTIGSIQIYLNRNSIKRSDEGWVINNPILMLLGQWVAEITNILRRGDCIEAIASPGGERPEC